MKRLFILFIVACIVGCTDKPDEMDKIDEMIDEELTVSSVAWLEGRWISEDPAGSFMEEWTVQGGELHGKASTLKGSDTVMTEQLKIAADASGLNYVVTLPNRTVIFRSKGFTESVEYKTFDYNESFEVVFANDTNDFPREILYRRPNSDSLYITLRGSEGGKSIEQVLKMKKV